MTPKHALEVIANSACLSVGIGPYPSEGVQHFVRRGSRIPDFLLPGGLLKQMLRRSPQMAEALRRLTSSDAMDVPDYVIQQWLLTPEEMKHLPAERHARWWLEHQRASMR